MRIFNHFISTLFNLPAATGSATLALSLFEYLSDPKSPYEPDLFTVNIVLRHYARKKDLQAMMDLIDRLPTFRLAPDLVTYTTLISGLLDAGKPSAAKGILDVMQKANIQPNSYVYSLLIADLAKKGSSDAMVSAEALIRQMNKVGVKATAITWTALASGYFRANMVQEGLEAIKRARSKGVEMTRVSYNMVLRSILYAEFVPVQELAHILRGQSRHKDRSIGSTTDTEAALLLLKSMIDHHVEPDVDTWFITLDSLARQGKWLEGETVIRLMNSRKFIVKEGSVLSRVVQQIRLRDRGSRR
jgi:pentatricopeptide repeat protein